MYRLRFLAPALVVALLTGGWLMGDDKKPDPKDTPNLVPIRVSLPPNYKKLGLTDKQKADVYKVRASYIAKIAILQQQIAELREKETADTEKILTDAQKARLRELRGGGSGKTTVPEKPVVKDKEKK